MAMSLLMKYTSRYLVTVAVEVERAGVRGMETLAEPVGEMSPIFMPTGTQRPVVQVTRSAVPEIANDVEGKNFAEGLVIVKVVGISTVLVIVITFVALEVKESGRDRLSVFAGTVKVLGVVEADVPIVIVWAAVDFVLKVRRPVKSVLVVKP